MSKYCNNCGQQVRNSGHVCSAPAQPTIYGVMGHGRCTPVYGPNGEMHWVEHETGMSKRETMAMHLMAGAVASSGLSPDALTVTVLAKSAVIAADALLEALGAD